MAIKVKIDKTDLSTLLKGMAKAPKITTTLLERAVAASQFVLQKNTIKDNPVPYQTGFLLSSFRYENPIKGQSSKLIARWFPTIKYAAYVDSPKYNRSGSANFMKKIEKKSRPEINKLFKTTAERIMAEITKI